MKKKPIIGISSSLIVDQGGMFPGYKRAYVNKDYVDAVLENGGIPLIIPFTEDEEVIKLQIDIVDGLILSGGHDVDPLNYNEEPKQKLGEIFPERDKYDFALLKYSKEKKIPILGICRGFQVINVYEGGNLYQDLSYVGSEVLKHSQGHRPELKTHKVEIMDNSILKDIIGENEIGVNSFHHQVIKDVAPNYNIVAKAKDGVVEAIENKDYPFLLGVQWHPEMMFRYHKDINKIFVKFIEKCMK